MADDRLTNSDIGVLLVLMIEARQISNVELKEAHQLTLDGAQRKKLNELKLVVSEKPGRAFVHELTDAGWRRCREELLPPRTPMSGVISAKRLQAVLASVGRYLDQEDLSAADFFRPAVPVVGGDAIASNDSGAARAADGSLDDAIVSAYRKAGKGASGWLRLSALRPLLGNAARPAVDEALIRLDREQVIVLAPEENQKTLSTADIEAAVLIGGRPYHLILVEKG